jgi:hypothetical protein
MIGLIKDVPGLNRARLNVPERSKVAVEMIGLRSAASQSADLESRTRTLPHRTLLGTAISSGCSRARLAHLPQVYHESATPMHDASRISRNHQNYDGH